MENINNNQSAVTPETDKKASAPGSLTGSIISVLVLIIAFAYVGYLLLSKNVPNLIGPADRSLCAEAI